MNDTVTANSPEPKLYPMEFSDTDPRFLPNSNTFRLGDKWAVLRPGDLVQPGRTRPGQASVTLGGEIEVKAVHVMRLGHALQEHAMRNHGIKEENAKRRGQSEGYPGLEPAGPDYLRAILNKSYVATDFTDDTLVVTVVEFGKVVDQKLVLDEKAFLGQGE